MVGTSTERSGAITWVSSIRTTMANDPGRQLLEDQIQTSGFLFLEDYMESILSGPKYDPIIELVKTPARRKEAPKKTRAATAAAIKANAIMTMDLDDEDFDKENEVPAAKSTPINPFHKALLQTKDENSSKLDELPARDVRNSANSVLSSKPPSSKKKPNSKTKAVAISTPEPEHILTDEGDDEAEEDLVEKLVTPPRSRTLSIRDHEMQPPEPIIHPIQADQPQPEINNELSVIAEDDEPAEGSQLSIAKPSAEAKALAKRASGSSSNRTSKSSKPYHKKDPPKIDMMTVMDIDDFTQTTNFTIASSNSAQSFQTVPLDSPPAVPPKLATDEGVTSRSQSPKPRLSMPHEEDFTTAPLPEADAHSAVVSKERLTDTIMAQKSNVSQFTIGPPSPLRKSMRIPREPSLAANHAAPVAKPAATRSSWLVKAREAKAMEDNAKKLAAIPTFSHHVVAGNKRKSGEMLGTEPDNVLDQDAIGRTQKSTKMIASSPATSTLKEHDKYTFERFRDETAAIIDEDLNEDLPTGDGADMINKLKKTVAGFSARSNKSMGKSLGGAAATALAEARAAAEAKIAERNAAEGRVAPPATTSPVEKQNEPKAPSPTPVFVPPAETRQSTEVRKSSENNRRLSVSDLVTKPQTKKSLEHERVFQPPPPEQPKNTKSYANDGTAAANTSTSTTPPNSPPPKTRPPIFTLPEKPKLPPMPTFFPPTASQAFTRVEPQPFLPQRAAQPLSAQSTLFSTQSTYPESMFDNEMPPWVPSTQDTDLSDHVQSQNLLFKGNTRDVTEPETDMDADESWHLDDKFGEAFTPVVVGMKEDSMTWSTMPTRSTRSGDTGTLDESVPPRLKPSPAQELLEAKKAAFDVIPSDNPPYTTDEEEDMDVEYDEDIASVRLVTPSIQSHESTFSTQPSKLQPYNGDQGSSNNTGGFFSSASKLVSSVLGGSKKGKEPVKSLQLAAAVAKKQQEEADKKASRLKEMEARRQQVMQKKVDEEKTREEKKAKEESERRKREREKEDTTEKRALKLPGKKLPQLEDDTTKKRKLAEPEKKIEMKKPSSNMTTSKIGKFVPTGSQSGPSSSAIPAKGVKQTTVSSIQNSTVKVTNSTADAKSALAVKGKGKAPDFAFKSQPQAPQSQMQARYQAQFDDSRKAEIPPPVPTESIELPDINSEYSDSDDENRVRTFDPPNWAQSPALREALATQSTVNPDDIFGAIRPLKMEELFKNRTSRFRARTSSANWAGADELTAHEEREYVRRMGYKG